MKYAFLQIDWVEECVCVFHRKIDHSIKGEMTYLAAGNTKDQIYMQITLYLWTSNKIQDP